ncbi:MAG: TIGR03915 family putative DNA repair protein [Bacteroidales bacterium]|jgi:probable DNA metabolism protein|nr:TIGR03915 family putative DNA repair protein [Bacteroidales bacterium]
MIIFRYDKTFEGLLTVVFDAYFRNVFPERLLNEREVAPLFAEDNHKAITDETKAARVWKGLQHKLSRGSCNMITHVWLSEQPHCDELIFRFIRKIFDNNQLMDTDFRDVDVLEMRQVARKVAVEAERVRQFVRFQKTVDGIFFAPIAPLYNALPLSINYFTHRFADQMWIVYDTTRNYGFYYDLKSATEITLDTDIHFPNGKLDDTLTDDSEKFYQQLWKTYFNSITIKERINLKLHRQNLPIRFWKYLTEKN